MSRWWARVCAWSGPTKIGLGFAIGAGLLAGIGWFVNPQFAARSPLSLLLAVGISSIVWGIVAWAIATAARDVERDVEQVEHDEQQ